MDDIKKINKKIRSLVYEIIFASFIGGIALFAWLNPETTLAKIATANTSQTVTLQEIEPLNLENIYPVDDEYAISNYDKAVIRVTNNGNNSSTYDLIYRISNNSTLDASWLKFMLNIDETNNVEFLSNLKTTRDNNYTYYTLYTGTLEAHSKKDFEYLMWLDKNVGNEAQNKSLSANLMVKSYGTDLSFN